MSPSRAPMLALAALALGCSVDEDAFQARVFTCDTAARDPLCGTDRDGQPMTCFAASQLDGADFCAPSCGEVMTFEAESAVCVQGGAKLASCHPDDDTTPNGPCGRPDL